jgi:hypothetical protein
MCRRVDIVLTVVSEKRVASIFMVEEKEANPQAKNQREQVSTLKMEAIRSSKTSVNTISTRSTFQKTASFKVTAVKTSNLTILLKFVIFVGQETSCFYGTWAHCCAYSSHPSDPLLNQMKPSLSSHLEIRQCMNTREPDCRPRWAGHTTLRHAGWGSCSSSGIRCNM